MGKAVVGLWSRDVKNKFKSLDSTLVYLSRAIHKTKEFANAQKALATETTRLSRGIHCSIQR